MMGRPHFEGWVHVFDKTYLTEYPASAGSKTVMGHLRDDGNLHCAWTDKVLATQQRKGD